MPREQITHNRIIESHTAPSEDGQPSATVNREMQRRNLHVAWYREPTGWVQVGIDVTVAVLRDWLAAAEREAEAASLETEEYATEHHPYRVFSDVLDRHEMNLAIRALRRARDAAYGADE